MDADHIALLQKNLLAEKAVLEAELSKIATKNPAIEGDWTALPPEVSDSTDTMDEKAQNVTDYEERRAIEHSLELRLREIDDTLKKLTMGTYGICNTCANPIDAKRLAAMLVVNTCYSCANKSSFA